MHHSPFFFARILSKANHREFKCQKLNHEEHPELNKRTHLTGQGKKCLEIKKTGGKRKMPKITDTAKAQSTQRETSNRNAKLNHEEHEEKLKKSGCSFWISDWE
jgi:hypothetical protein